MDRENGLDESDTPSLSDERSILSPRKKVLVLGGTGHFGRRICRRLARERGIDLVVSSRNHEKAQALASELRRDHPEASITGIAIDQHATGLESQLMKLSPFVVLHTAGPYQTQDYRVAEACIRARSHYVDLADAREFVCEFSALDEQARASKVLLVSGASTLPGLSSAVIDEIRPRFRQIDGIEISIAPAHQTPRGEGTVAAVLSYCGSPFEMLKAGEWKTVFGWQDLRMQKYPALGRRLGGACNVPDLSLLPRYVPSVRNVSFHAALECKAEQLALWLMASCARLGLVRDWSRVVPFFAAVSKRVAPFGSDRGGMCVRVTGEDLRGVRGICTWYLGAERNHGPEVPCSPMLVLVRKLLRDRLDLRGARACLGLVTLAEFNEEIAEFAISSEMSMEFSPK
jgi:saccharopine dehydrogenase-like NADP-dependent oxidoreductase